MGLDQLNIQQQEVQYKGGSLEAEYHYSATLLRLAIPLRIELWDALIKQYSSLSGARSARPNPVVGDFRFLWRGVEDNQRLADVVIALLQGQVPRSDFDFLRRRRKAAL